MHRQNILWYKSYQCFLRSASQGNRNKNKTKQMLPNQSYTATRSKPVNPKGNQPWIFTGRTDAGAEALILWPPDVKNWLIGKDPDVRKDWGQEEKGITHTHFWTVLEKTLDSPLDSKEIKPVHPKWNQPWIFIGRSNAEAETPIFGHVMWKTDLL